jgi:isocitrate dehydrogenase
MNEVRGEKIQIQKGRVQVPDNPIIPFIEGDGTGPDIWRATRRVLDAAVQTAYAGKRRIVWHEVLAGEGQAANGRMAPIGYRRRSRCASSHKGPLTTPVGGGIEA